MSRLSLPPSSLYPLIRHDARHSFALSPLASLDQLREKWLDSNGQLLQRFLVVFCWLFSFPRQNYSEILCIIIYTKVETRFFSEVNQYRVITNTLGSTGFNSSLLRSWTSFHLCVHFLEFRTTWFAFIKIKVGSVWWQAFGFGGQKIVKFQINLYVLLQICTPYLENLHTLEDPECNMSLKTIRQLVTISAYVLHGC